GVGDIHHRADLLLLLRLLAFLPLLLLLARAVAHAAGADVQLLDAAVRHAPAVLDVERAGALRRPKVIRWSMILFRKPVPTANQVRGRLFRDHALLAAHDLPVLGRDV